LLEGGEEVEVALCVEIPAIAFVVYLPTPLLYSTKYSCARNLLSRAFYTLDQGLGVASQFREALGILGRGIVGNDSIGA